MLLFMAGSLNCYQTKQANLIAKDTNRHRRKKK
ncbi:hypothetical protein MXB_5229 [Myxobolus squamalis]|nr:hypothetical protein MXB_5229 [Myxobolus squamalis]